MKLNIQQPKKNEPTLIVVGCLHGNEIVGKKVINELKKLKIIKGKLITIIGNPIAVNAKKRFIGQDLNRSFPGNKNSHILEEKIAYNILQNISKKDYVVDIHSTSSDTEDVVIVKKKDEVVNKIIKLINPKRVVLMPKDYGNGSLINFCHGISIEYGKHSDKKTFIKSLNDIKLLMCNLKMLANCPTKIEPHTKFKVIPNTEFYEVFGTEPKPEGFKLDSNIKNFEYVQKGQVLGSINKGLIFAKEGFYPVLFGEKAYKDIIGFKAIKIN